MLTDVQAREAQAGDKDYKLADASGLYLFVTRSGFKSWRMKYRFGGKEKRLTFGAYPEVSLEEARERRDQARRLLRDQIDPALERQRLKAAGFPMDDNDAGVAEAPTQAPPPIVVSPAFVPVPPPPAPVAPPLIQSAPPPDPAAAPVLPHAHDIEDAPAVPVAASPAPARPEPVEPAPPKPSNSVSSPMPPAADVPRVAADDEPAQAIPFTPEVATGSRALSLLRQAEEAAEAAASQSRAAKRVGYLVLLVLGLLACGLVWWAVAGHRQGVAAATVAAPMVAHAALPAPKPVPAPAAPAASASPAAAAPVTPSSPSAAPGGGAPAMGGPAVPAPAHAAPAQSAATAAMSRPVSADTAPARYGHARHHRHRRHRGHRRHHRHTRYDTSTTRGAASSFRSGERTRLAPAFTHSLSRETHHDVQVTAPRAEHIDPALDRFGRASLCLRAAYSADPSCAALRPAGR